MAVRIIALCLLVFLSLAAAAESLTGKVVRVVDGDTIHVLDDNHKQGALYHGGTGCEAGVHTALQGVRLAEAHPHRQRGAVCHQHLGSAVGVVAWWVRLGVLPDKHRE